MKQVFVICEGFTERAFVLEVLAREYPEIRLNPVFPGKPFNRSRAGHIRFARVKPDILAVLKSHRENHCTTFFDYYALGDFPMREASARLRSPSEKAALIEQAVEEDISHELGAGFNPSRFKAYLSMHEFEGLLFSDPSRLAAGLYQPELEPTLKGIRSEFESPEHINDDPASAPSKRLANLIPGYDKVNGGNLAALSVGIAAMKRECRHFRDWLDWVRGI